MRGEIAIGGVYLPAALIIGAVALVITGLVARLFASSGLYRFVAYRPLVDVALFVLIFAALSWASAAMELAA